jgi:MYXO-CTERM domain-containing protein
MDTGWLPADESIQVRFIIELGDTFAAELPGDAVLDGSQLSFDGEQDAGSFMMNVGPEVQCLLRLDLDVPGVGPVEWEGEIPYTPNFDFRFDDETSYTPFLLQGSPDRPASLQDEVPQYRLIEVDLAGSVIPVPGISGGIAVDVAGLMNATLQGDRIAVDQLEITQEGQSIQPDLPASGGWQEQCSYDATLGVSGTLYFYPTVFVEILLSEYELAEFEIPVDVPEVQDDWSFDPEDISFDVGSPDGGQPDGTTTDGGNGSSDTSGGGCSCGTRPDAGFAGLFTLLVLLGLVRFRRS